MRHVAIVLVLALAAATCGGDESSGITLTDADSGREIALASGDRFTLELGSNASTGFRWVIPDAGKPEMITLRSEDFVEADTDLIGASGVQIYTFEASGAGAGVLRLEYLRPFDDPPIPERIVEYIVRVDGAPWPPATADTPATTTETVPPPNGASSSDPIPVSALFDGEGARDAVVVGFVVWEPAGARFCEVLLESYPPQCGQMWIVIANPDGLEVALDEAQGIRWTPSPVEVDAHFDGDRLILSGSDSAAITEPDEELAAAFMDFVADPSGETADPLPLADDVALGLGDEIVRTETSESLEDPTAWVIDREEFRAWSGPFSALEFATEPIEVSVGARARCAAPPVAAPDGFEDLRRVSLRPTDATSCLEWWTVDFFIDDAGLVHAVTLDLFAP